MLDARLSTATFQPAADVQLEAVVSRLDGAEDEAPLDLLAPQTTDSQGLARFELRFQHAGEYVVRVGVSDEDDAQAEIAILVAHEPRELKRVQPNPTFLKALSQASEARYIDDDVRLNALDFKPTQSLRVDERKDVPIWSSGWVLILLALSLGTEWLIRRRHGMS